MVKYIVDWRILIFRIMDPTYDIKDLWEYSVNNIPVTINVAMCVTL